MQKGLDSKIQAKVRILLARRWVDLGSVTVGTTNGVVYLGGRLQATGGPGPSGATSDPPGHDAWRQRIRREIAAIPEVRDVVFRLHDTDLPEGPCRERSA